MFICKITLFLRQFLPFIRKYAHRGNRLSDIFSARAAVHKQQSACRCGNACKKFKTRKPFPFTKKQKFADGNAAGYV